MNKSYLAEPSKKYQKSFEKYVLAYQASGEVFYYEKYKKAIENFDEFLDDQEKQSKGIDLPADEVAATSFWLIDQNEVVGVVRVRPEILFESYGNIGYDISPHHRQKGYGSRILALALEKAKAAGLKEARVTCAMDNAASRKIIEKNNGTLLGTVWEEEDCIELYHYSIVLA